MDKGFSFAETILRRCTADATSVALVALILVAFPTLAQAYRAGIAHTGNLRTILRHLKPCGLAVLQAHEPQVLILATRAGPREIDQFCRHLADLDAILTAQTAAAHTPPSAPNSRPCSAWVHTAGRCWPGSG